jgi:hypothetical protein
MKNSLKNLKLWQKKRNELSVNDDKQADWLGMNALLDQQMPVSPSTGKVSWLRSKKLKTFALTFVSLSAAAMVYVVSGVYQSKDKKDNNAIHHHNRFSHVLRDIASLKDSVTAVDSSFKRDSAELLATSNSSKIDSIKPNAANLPHSQNSVIAQPLNKKQGDSLTTENSSTKNTGSNATSKNSNNTTTNKRDATDGEGKKPGKSSLLAGNSKKINDDKSNPDKTANSNKTSDKTVANRNLAYNGANANAGNANASKSNSGKARIHSSKLYSGVTVPISSSSGKIYKGKHIGNRALYGSASKTSKLKPADSADSDVPASADSQSIPNRKKHHQTNKKIEGDDSNEDANGNDADQKNATLTQATPKVDFEAVDAAIKDAKLPLIKMAGTKRQVHANTKGSKKTTDKTQTEKTKTSSGSSIFSKMDWGVLLGVNSSGSFRPKSEDANFYGSAPVDFFVGLSATYNFNPKWALYSQVKVLTPQNISYNYPHVNDGLLDSARLQINSGRKIYSLEIPLLLSYRVNNYLSVRAGPMISIPIKQANVTNRILTPGSKQDSAYYVSLTDSLKGTQYLPKLNFGFSGGINFQYKRLSFGAMWNQSLSSYQINSDFGTYSTKPGTFQFNIGWQLDKVKLK